MHGLIQTLLTGALAALLIAGFFWHLTVRHMRPELKGRVVFRGLFDTLHPRYYGKTGLRYRRLTLIAYSVMVALSMAALATGWMAGGG